jgi:hypothetical protein
MTNRTLTDIELSRVYFEMLIDFAKRRKGETVSYGELVVLAQAAYPDHPYVQKAIAVSMGRRLDALRDFTASNGLPDLSSLVVNKSTGDNGEGFKRSFDGDSVRQQVADFDWNSVQVSFESFIATEKDAALLRDAAKRAPKPKRVKEDVARQMWWDYFKDNRASLGDIDERRKEAIIRLIMACCSVEEALQQVRALG